MRGTRIFTANAFLILSAVTCMGAGEEYFPLQTGNSWVYKPTRGPIREPQVVEVGSITTVGGRDYYHLRFFGRDLLVRMTEDATLVAYDAESKQEKPWVKFSAPEGQSFESTMDQCTKSAKIDSKAAKYSGPVGDFSNALQVSYVQSCADAGFSLDVFLPYIGLVQHSVQNFAGEIPYHLVYSRTGLTTVDPKQVSFALSLEGGPVFAAPGRGTALEILARMTLRNTSSETIGLNFSSGQTFDIAVKNEKGERVYTWSADKLFIQALRSEKIEPGERNFTATLVLNNLPAGKYSAEAFLTTLEPRQYAASVGFEVK